MKLLLTFLMAVLASAPGLMAQSQVNYSAAPGQPAVYNIDGSALANGNAVWIGTFDATFNVTAFANQPQQLLAHWHPFGQNVVTTIGGQPGRFSGSSSSTDPFFGNQKIYLWIFSTDSAAAPATNNFGNVNEYGLYSCSTNSNWAFSPDPPPSNLRTINSGHVNDLFFGSRDLTHLYLSPGFIVVPEPSTVALLSIAIPAALLALRRRR